MKQAAEMGSGAMIYTPHFIHTGSGIQKLMVGGQIYAYIQTERQHGDFISVFLFFVRK
jgi:hypothetical protein